MNQNPQLQHALFEHRENNYKHLPYEKELQFYEAVKEGDIPRLKEIMVPLDNSQLGVLSPNPVRNLQYHLTITISFITRFCMEGGMDVETAYTLSDVNIRKLDSCTTQKQLTDLHRELVFDYALRMKKIHGENSTSCAITQCIDYIYSHLHDPITIQILAQQVGLNPTYLCGLFKKEMHQTIGQFLMSQRIDAAKNLLRFSDYAPLDIANYLCFSSHSHFIQVFKRYTGRTPREYRQRYYRSNWKI